MRRSANPQMTYSVSIEPCNTVTALPPTLLPESVLPSSGSIATGATLTESVRLHRSVGAASAGGAAGGVHGHAITAGAGADATLTLWLAGPPPSAHGASRHQHSKATKARSVGAGGGSDIPLAHRHSTTTNAGYPIAGPTTAAAGSASGKFTSKSGSQRKQAALASSFAFASGGGAYGALGGAVVDLNRTGTSSAVIGSGVGAAVEQGSSYSGSAATVKKVAAKK